MSRSSKWLAAFLTAVLALQLSIFQRQGAIARQLESLARSDSRLSSMENQLFTLEHHLRELAEADRWLAIGQAQVGLGSSCDLGEARVEWELIQWNPESRVRLLYRARPEADWKEAEVEALGGPNFAATFPVAGRPMLELGISTSVDRKVPTPSISQVIGVESEAIKPEGVEYQILVESPGQNQSSGVRALPLGGDWRLPVKLDVRQLKESYTVLLSASPDRQSPCTTLEEAEVRAYRGGQVEVIPFAVVEQQLRQAEWKSKEAVSHLEIMLRVGGIEKVIPVRLADR